MDKAASEEKKRKATAATDNRKRPLSVPSEQAEAKRPKLEPDAATTNSASFLAAFDFTSLPSALITELIVANLEAFTEPALIGLVQAFRESRGLGNTAPTPAAPSAPPPSDPVTPQKAVPSHVEKERRDVDRTPPPQARKPVPVPTPAPPPPPPVTKVKDEPLDPLQMDIDQDELEYEPDRLNEEVRIIKFIPP